MECPNALKHHMEYVKEAASHLSYEPKCLYYGTVRLAANDLRLEAHDNNVNKACTDRQHPGELEAYFGSIQDISLPKKPIDIVLNLDCIGHTYTPMEDLKKCFDMLRPGGVMHLETPYLGCPDHRSKGEAWQLFSCGYFCYFTMQVLQDMVKKAGFRLVDVKVEDLITIIAQRPPTPGLVGAVQDWYARLAA